MNVNTFLMMGKTGSGKGVQAALLSKETGFKIFSSGEKFREMRSKDNWLAKRIKEDYDKGLLMPHWFASFIFEEALLDLSDGEGLIFEGTGRKIPEAELFNEVALWLRREYRVFDIKVSDEEVISRSLKRGRDDGLDADVDKIKIRLSEYKKFTEPAIAYFKNLGKVIEINGEQSIESVHNDIIKAIKI